MTPELKRRRVLQYWHRATMFDLFEVKLVDDSYYPAPSQQGFCQVLLVRGDGHHVNIGRLQEGIAHEVVGMLRRAIKLFLFDPTPPTTARYLAIENAILAGEFDFKPEQAGAVDGSTIR